MIYVWLQLRAENYNVKSLKLYIGEDDIPIHFFIQQIISLKNLPGVDHFKPRVNKNVTSCLEVIAWIVVY